MIVTITNVVNSDAHPVSKLGRITSSMAEAAVRLTAPEITGQGCPCLHRGHHVLGQDPSSVPLHSEVESDVADTFAQEAVALVLRPRAMEHLLQLCVEQTKLSSIFVDRRESSP